MARRRRRARRIRRNPSSTRTTRRSSGGSWSTGKTVAVGGAAVYGVGALVQLGLQIQKALAGTGRSVYLSDIGNALLWPLSLVNITAIPIGGPILVPTALPPPPTVQNTAASKVASVGGKLLIQNALNNSLAQQVRNQIIY